MNISPASISLIQSQVLSTLMGSSSGSKGDDSWEAIFSLLATNGAEYKQSGSDPLSLLMQGNAVNRCGCLKLSGSPVGFAAGRNMALADPESAYRMMSVINNRDVYYKAQFSELSQMQASVLEMQEAGQSLGSIALSTGNEDIKSQLQAFVGQYNSWIQSINPDIQQGGLLADTQAAHASQFELEQNVNNRLFGAKDGLHGLSDLGITIERNTRLATLDIARLDALLASNKQGVVDTVQEFSTNFAKSASMLNAEGNFILKQLDNLDRAIHFIADNKDSLQKEFGLGDAALPKGKIAQALAEYNKVYGA